MKNKMKTKKSLAKRVIKTGTGKLKIQRAGTSHLAHGKTQKQKRHLRKDKLMASGDLKRNSQLLQD